MHFYADNFSNKDINVVDTQLYLEIIIELEQLNIDFQLTMCCEPQQKLRVRLWPVILYYGSFRGNSSVVVLVVLCLGVEFLCCLRLMCVFIF